MRILLQRLLLSLLLIACDGALAEESRGQAGREAEIAAIYRSHFPLLLEVSPDGSRVLLKDVDHGEFVLKVLDLRTKSQAVVERSRESQLSPKWSRSGTRIAYTIPAIGGRLSQLKIADIATQASKSVGEPMESLAGISWSPDDSLIAYVARVDRQRMLGVISVADSKAQQIGVLAAEGSFAWAPAGRRLAYVPSDAPTSIRVLDIDRTTSDVSIPGAGEISALEWRNDGKALLAAVRPASAEFPHLVEFAPVSHTVREILVTVEGEVGEIRAVGPHMLFSEQRNGSRKLFLLDPNQRKRPIATGGQLAWTVGAADHPDRFYVVESTKLGMELELTEIDVSSRNRRSLHRLSAGYRPEIAMTMVAPTVSAKHSTNALYWRPSSSASTERALVIMVHGGPKLSYLPSWRPELNVLLRFGIDVLQLNYSGSSGYGANYAAGLPNAVADILATVEYAQSTLGYKRSDIYLLGDSFGAGLALEASGQLAQPIGGLILFSFLGNAHGSASVPAKVLVFHGANDPVAAPNRALQALKNHWGIADQTEPEWWRIVEGEGHSFRKIEAWASVLNAVISFVKPGVSKHTAWETQ